MVPTALNPLSTALVALAWTLSAAVRIDGLRDAALAWHIPPPASVYRGERLFMDAGRHAPLSVRVAREVQRSNTRISPVDALLLATRAIDAAHSARIAPAFFAATLLQESGFDPRAISAAGAVGIAQFTVPTALDYGIEDPWDPSQAIDGCAHLLAAYAADYRGGRDDPYALAAAAYNAGPGTIAYYHGVPPYAETRVYVQDIRERWSRIVGR